MSEKEREKRKEMKDNLGREKLKNCLNHQTSKQKIHQNGSEMVDEKVELVFFS